MNYDFRKSFAKNLKALMKDMSQSEFAKAVEIPQQTISRYLSCKHTVTVENLCKIADYFGEKIDVLLGRSEY